MKTAFRSLPMALTLLAAVLWPGSLSANTANFVAEGFGVDDWNISRLIDSVFFAQCFFITDGAASKGYTAANGYTFNYGGPIAESDLTVNLYKAWVVTNDPQNDPGGTNRARPVTDADAGGADWAVTYKPTNPGDPFTDASGTVHFIQAYHEILNERTGGTEDNPVITTIDRYVLDAAGFNQGAGNPNGQPWYDALGISSMNAGNGPSWMFDVPYDCENSGTPNQNGTNVGPSPTCQGGTDGFLLSSSVTFQSFVAKDYGNGLRPGEVGPPDPSITHNVVLYGGLQWGYRYTNFDTPEPTLGLLTGGGLLGLLYARKRRRRG